jgi:hypothetical protein
MQMISGLIKPPMNTDGCGSRVGRALDRLPSPQMDADERGWMWMDPRQQAGADELRLDQTTDEHGWTRMNANIVFPPIRFLRQRQEGESGVT